jgi:hypothetical protein
MDDRQLLLQWGQFDKPAPERRKDLAPLEAKSLIHMAVKPLQRRLETSMNAGF